MSTSNFFTQKRSPVKILREDYGLGCIDLMPTKGRFDNYPLNILNSRNGSEIRFPSLRFRNYYDKSVMEISFQYNITTGNFSVRETPKKRYIDRNGVEHLISQTDFYSKNSLNRREVQDEEGRKSFQYIVPGTNEVLTKEQFSNLEATQIDAIESGARMYLCEFFREYLFQSSYRANVKNLKDVRPDTNWKGEQIQVKRFDAKEMEEIIADINNFILGKRSAVVESKEKSDSEFDTEVVKDNISV